MNECEFLFKVHSLGVVHYTLFHGSDTSCCPKLAILHLMNKVSRSLSFIILLAVTMSLCPGTLCLFYWLCRVSQEVLFSEGQAWLVLVTVELKALGPQPVASLL